MVFAMARSETLIITGATGDLTRRFLLPALGALLDSEPERRIELIGAGRRAHPDWLGSVRKAFGGYQGPAIQHTLTHTRWVTADASQTADWRRLLNCSGTPVTVYFALSPRAMRAAAVALQGVPLPPNTRLAVEKPFGQDAASARELNALLLEVVDEEQIFRVDHFLAAPAVLGMPTLRFGNRLLAESWQREQLAEVNIVWDEALGLTGRAGCYDTAGALRDMIQSHLLQVLAATIMPTPAGPEGRPAAMRAALESLCSAAVALL